MTSIRWLNRVALAVAALLLAAAPVFAGPQDYRFELAGQPVKAGKVTMVKVRLVHVPDGKPVPGAIIIQTRFDMGPDGMGTMTAPAKALSPAEPGVYQIETQPSMAGNWALTLAAKVQGEADTVRGSVTVAVPK